MYFLQSVCINSFTSYEFLYKIQHTKHNGISLCQSRCTFWLVFRDVVKRCFTSLFFKLDNDQGVTSTSTRFTYFIVSKGLFFLH